MKYVFVVDKSRKVIYSCNSVEQLTVARKYCRLLVIKWRLLTNIGGIESCLSTFSKQNELFDAIDIWIKVRRRELCK